MTYTTPGGSKRLGGNAARSRDPKKEWHPGVSVRALRESRGWGQAELSEKVGWGQQRVSRHETGRTPIDAEALAAYADALETTSDALLGRAPLNLGPSTGQESVGARQEAGGSAQISPVPAQAQGGDAVAGTRTLPETGPVSGDVVADAARSLAYFARAVGDAARDKTAADLLREQNYRDMIELLRSQRDGR